jgi:hypothetical protein
MNKMNEGRVVLPLTLEQRELLAGALDITFRSETFPLELELEFNYEPEQAGSVETAARMGINRIIVTNGTITT